MRVLIVSKAFVIAEYRRKLTELASRGLHIVAVSPPAWREGGSVQPLEEGDDGQYDLRVSPIRLNGHFHLHWYPRLQALLTEVRPDLLHIDEEPYNLATYLAVHAAARLGIPSIFFTWQNIERRYPPPFRQMERYVYRHVGHGMAGSDAAAEVLRHKGFRGDIAVIPQFGVDPDVFSVAEPIERPFTVGFLNRLVHAKDPLLALRAFSTLSPESRMVIAGDGPLRSEIDRYVAENRLGHRVTIRGRVPSHDVPGLLHSLDVVLLPSRTTAGWKEQFGRVLVEGMAAGVPAVATNSGEIPWVLGDAGLIVPDGDDEAFGAALRRLQNDPELRRDLAQRGRRRVLERFTHARIAAATEDVYRRVVEGAFTTSLPTR